MQEETRRTAGVLIGIIERLGGVLVGENMAEIIVFVLFIIILLVKPNGLLVRNRKG